MDRVKAGELTIEDLEWKGGISIYLICQVVYIILIYSYCNLMKLSPL